nr:MAG TPA: hypothetical protein [Caudoviricetes sp.]
MVECNCKQPSDFVGRSPVPDLEAAAVNENFLKEDGK